MVRPISVPPRRNAASRVVRAVWVLQVPRSRLRRELAAGRARRMRSSVSSGTTDRAGPARPLVGPATRCDRESTAYRHRQRVRVGARGRCSSLSSPPLWALTRPPSPPCARRAPAPFVRPPALACPVRSIRVLAAAWRLAVIEDSACALGTEVLLDGRWQRSGAHSRLATFSFIRSSHHHRRRGISRPPIPRWPTACACCATTACPVALARVATPPRASRSSARYNRV